MNESLRLPLTPLLLGAGAIIFLEGIQQAITKKSAAKKGLNRLHVYNKARKILKNIEKPYSIQMNNVHKNLEDDIHKIRVHEKRAEFWRYIISFILGSAVGMLPILSADIHQLVFGAVGGAINRIMWFILPYGALQGGRNFFSLFSPQEAYATSNYDEYVVGEGSYGVDDYISRASLDNPAIISAENQELINPFSGDEILL